MFNENSRNSIRNSHANVSNISQLLRISSQYDGALSPDADPADVLPRNLCVKGARLG